MVIERNWLEVYPYTKWGGNANLPVFRIDERFIPTELLLHEVGFCLFTLRAHVHNLSFFIKRLSQGSIQ